MKRIDLLFIDRFKYIYIYRMHTICIEHKNAEYLRQRHHIFSPQGSCLFVFSRHTNLNSFQDMSTSTNLCQCYRQPMITMYIYIHMDVSKNKGTPKSSFLIGFSIIFTIHFGGPTPIFGNTHIYIYIYIPWKILEVRD